MRLQGGLLALALALGPMGAAAQGASLEPPRIAVRSPVLIIDTERLLAETRFGRRLAADLREQAEALTSENERLTAELTAEERSLTERRPLMEPEAFRAEADAFDGRVQRIRAEQDAKQEALAASVEAGEEGFQEAVRPVLGRLMIEMGAAAILDGRQVIVSASAIDVTDEAIAAIDAQLGDGTGEPASAPQAPAPAAPRAAPSGETEPSQPPEDTEPVPAPAAPVGTPLEDAGPAVPEPRGDDPSEPSRSTDGAEPEAPGGG